MGLSKVTSIWSPLSKFLVFHVLGIVTIALLVSQGCHRGKLVERIDSLLEKGKLKEAEQILIETDTTRAVYHLLMGDILRREDKLIRALSQYELAAISVSGRLRERLTQGLILLGRKSQKRGYIYIAEKAYKLALKIDPTYPLGDGFLLLGNLAFRKENYDTAYIYYKKYLSMGGNRRLVLTPYTISMFNLGLYDEILKLLPNGPRYSSADLVLYYDKTLYKKATEMFNEEEFDSVLKLLSKIPKDPPPGVILEDSISFLLGKTYENKGDTLKALYYYDNIVKSHRYTHLREMALERIRTLTLP